MTKINFKKLTTTAIIASMIIGLIMLSPMMILPKVGAASNDLSSDCIKSATIAEQSLAKQLDEAKAKSLAYNHSEFASRTSGHTFQYGGVFNDWTIDRTTCNPTWDNVNVVYFLGDAQGKYQKNLVFTMDPQLTKVTKIAEYASPSASTQYGYNWSGYDFAADSTRSTAVTDAYASFTIPSISKPTNQNCYQNPTSSFNCHLLIWDGLDDKYGASDGNLIQGGSGSNVTCNSMGGSCTTLYSMWWEALATTSPGNHIVYCSYAPSSGDSITSEETQDHFTSSTYYITVTDSTRSHSCSVTVTGYAMTSPSGGQFIDERPIYTSGMNKYPFNLAKFVSNSITGDITYNNAATSIYTPYSNGYYNLYYMTTNGGSTGTKMITPVGAVGNTGSFTQTWNTS